MTKKLLLLKLVKMNEKKIAIYKKNTTKMTKIFRKI